MMFTTGDESFEAMCQSMSGKIGRGLSMKIFFPRIAIKSPYQFNNRLQKEVCCRLLLTLSSGINSVINRAVGVVEKYSIFTSV